MNRIARNLLWASLLLMAATETWAAPTVALSEKKIRAGIGETISVDIVMTDFPTTEGGGLTLKFNPSVVRVVSIEINGTAWNFATRDGVIDNENGRVKDLLFSSFSGVSGDAVVATVTLETLRRGRSRLKLVESSLNPFASGGTPLDVALKKSIVRVR